MGAYYYYVDTTWDNRDNNRPGSTSYDYGGQVNDLYYKYFLVGSGNTDFGAGNDSSAIHWAAGPTVHFGSPCYSLPANISVSDYTTPSAYKYLTDNGYYGRDTVMTADNYPYCIAKSATLMGSDIDSLVGNPLFLRIGSLTYRWNKGPFHSGTFAIGSAPAIPLYNWGYDAASGVNWGFNKGNVPLVLNTDYRAEAEAGKPGDTVRAWLYGIGEYRGIDFVMITLDNPQQPPGVTVSGLVKSYYPQHETALELWREGEAQVAYSRTIPKEESGSGQLTQNFTFPGVEPGAYRLVITKAAHTSFTVHHIVVADKDVDLTKEARPAVQLMTMRCGDINGDGNINNSDLTIMWQQANYNRSAAAAANKLCDLNGDGLINNIDLTILWLAYNYNRGAVEINYQDSM
jgi:hypothetical protein